MINFTNLNFVIFVLNCVINIFNYFYNRKIENLIFQLLYNFFILFSLFKKKRLNLENENFMIVLLSVLSIL
ncbi:hypothetical protein ACWNYO_00280 [Candidatus Vidania fulgoroideorum]